MSKAEYVAEYRRRRKANLMRVAGQCCNICGYKTSQSALEFHHIEPSKKLYALSTGNCHDLESDLRELKKTILVCANCHREIHEGRFTKEDLLSKQVYDENVAQELRDEKKQLEAKTIYYCANCGIEITRGAVLCEKCSREARRKAERPTREKLKELIRTIPFKQIGQLYGVTDNAIRKWCDKEHLPREVSEIKQYTDEQWAEI